MHISSLILPAKAHSVFARVCEEEGVCHPHQMGRETKGSSPQLAEARGKARDFWCPEQRISQL